MRETIGTWAWAQTTGGALTRREKLTLLTAAIQAQIAEWVRRKRLPASALTGADMAKIRLPETAVVEAALEMCRAHSSPSLFNHCLRAYYFGAILGMQNRLRFDEEVFLVAALLHDIGLTDAHNGKDSSAHCFAVEGGRAAYEFLRGLGWAHQAAVAEAITLHLNVAVQPEQGVEAHLLRAGSGLDVIGTRYHEIHPAALAYILEQYPRLNFKAEITDLLGQQARQRPQSRMGFFFQVVGFERRIARNPFSE